MKFRPHYALMTLAVLAIEALIALLAHDRFIRPFVGDSLAVVLLYLGLRAALRPRVEAAAALALAIACVIEVGQLFDLVDRLGLGWSRVARIVLGTGFDPLDFVAYALGYLSVLAAERMRSRA